MTNGNDTKKDHPFITPRNVFSNEKIRGAITSVVSGGVSGGMNALGVSVLNLSAPMSALVMLYIFGSIFGYSVDIMFAKKHFTIKRGYRGTKPYSGPVPYTDIGTRALWLLASVIDKHFFRFVITVIIDTLIGIAILQALIKYANDKEFLMDFAFRDMFIAGAVSVFTFFLYNNVLRFDWAYNDQESPLMNVLILMWVAIVLMIYAVFYSISANQLPPSAANVFYGTALQQPFPTAASSLEQQGRRGDDRDDEDDDTNHTQFF